MSTPPGRTGFTLVELVLAIVVIGVLAAVAGPRFFGVREFSERAFSESVAAALRHARTVAVATGCLVEVRIASGAVTLSQSGNVGCAGPAYAQPVAHPGTGASTYRETAPSGMALASSVNPIRFDALGRARDAGGAVATATVTVGARTLRVEGETGFVTGP